MRLVNANGIIGRSS